MEYVKANGTEYECQRVTTGANSISFTMQGQEIETVHEAFKDVTELTVSGEDKVTYGIYGNLSFASATINSDGSVSVNMSIKSDMEPRLETLEEMVEIYGEAIADMAYTVASGTEEIETIKETNDIQDEAIMEIAGMVAGE